VATINLRNRSDRWLERRHLLVAGLVEAAPDLVSLQEIHFPIRQGQWLRTQVNLRLSGSGKEPYRLVQRRKQHLINGFYEGIGALSRLPILYQDSVALGYGGRVALRVHVELPSHQTMDFVSTHFHHVSYEPEARQEQAMRLVAWLRRHKHVPIQVIAGDLNETPDGLALQYLKQSFRSAYAERYGRDPLATFPTALYETESPALCLDYILISSAVQKVVEAGLFCEEPAPDDETLFASDHVGLIATLEV
jgi:endonuclease/exonuclease/phosphatase family metal-dependent hydrolase